MRRSVVGVRRGGRLRPDLLAQVEQALKNTLALP
jgi:hypothetical protein